MQVTNELVRALVGGTRTMRAAGERFLPKFEKEKRYKDRLRGSYLTPLLRNALQRHAGRVFSQPVQILSEAAEIPDLDKWLKDVDNLGAHVNRWSYDSFFAGEHFGLVHAFADATALFEGASKLDAQNEGARPWLLRLTADDLIGAVHDSGTEGEELVQIRFRETVNRPDAANRFGSKLVDRVRVIESGHFEVWEREAEPILPVSLQTVGAPSLFTTISTKLKAAVSQPRPGVKVDEGDFDADEIPLETFYTRQTGELVGLPYLEDLSYLNEEHWSLASAVNAGLAYAIRPWYFFAGFTKREVDAIDALGFSTKVWNKNIGSTVSAIEQPTNAIKLGQEALDVIEGRAEVLALDPLLKKRVGPETATGRQIDSTEAHADVQQLAINFDKFLNKAIKRWEAYVDFEIPDQSVAVHTDFASTEPEDIATIVDIFEKVSGMPEALQMITVEEMKRRDMLSDKVKAGDIIEAFQEMREEMPQGRFGEELAGMRDRFTRFAEDLRAGGDPAEMLAELDAERADDPVADAA